MSKKKRPERARTLRRTAERNADKLIDARRKLARLERGGSSDCPIEVTSASVIEPRAEGHRCPDCDGALRCHEHVVVAQGAQALRLVKLACRDCGAPHELYFRIVESYLN